MKKWMLGLVVAGLVMVAGIGGVLADEVTDGKAWSFEQMLPFMKKMHPDMNDETLKQMYDTCHGQGGMMGPGAGPAMHQQMMKDL